MFRGWFSLNSRCPGCGLSFERDEQEDYWLGAYLANFIVTEVVFAVLVLVILIATWPEPWWPLLWWGGAAQMILTPILFYPSRKPSGWLGTCCSGPRRMRISFGHTTRTRRQTSDGEGWADRARL
jgi:uncharacterized protein DUF983